MNNEINSKQAVSKYCQSQTLRFPHWRWGGDRIARAFVSWVRGNQAIHIPHGGTDSLLLFNSDIEYKRRRILIVVHHAIIAPRENALAFQRLSVGVIFEERDLGSNGQNGSDVKGAALP